MMLAQNFNPLPEPPNYYADPTALIYDTRQGPPLVNWEHVLLDNLDRYPWQFLNQFTVAGVRLDAEEPADAAQRRSTIARFAAALRTDPSAQRKLMNQVTSAIDLSVKRTQWNYKTAIPMYYPVTNQLMLMLPLCLVDAERPDLALVLERTNAGSYLARTVLMLDWAYKNARLVCRPTSDWLIATEIQESPVDAPPVPA